MPRNEAILLLAALLVSLSILSCALAGTQLDLPSEGESEENDGSSGAVDPEIPLLPPPIREAPPNGERVPQRRPPENREARRPTRVAETRSISLASVPFMIGDTQSGGCGSVEIGGAIAASLHHPTFACTRLNIAENNSPQLSDRLYLNYRHFHNASLLDAFSFAPTGAQADFNIDRFTLGIEKMVSENTSVEFRVPINRQMTSNIFASQTTGPVVSLPLDDYDVSLGNLVLIFKHSLCETPNSVYSGGFAVNLPTAPPVRIDGVVDDELFTAYDPDTGQPLPIPPLDVDLTIHGVVRNETINFSPFLAAVWTADDEYFAQGFCQVDLPLNGSTASLEADLRLFGLPITAIEDSDVLFQQTLLRLSLGGGRWLWRNDSSRRIHSLAVMVEGHYTTTLNDAELIGPVELAPNVTGAGALTFSVGNTANRVDVLDVVLGVPAVIGKTTITNGVALPLRKGADRGFDFEYSVTVNRRF